MFVTGFGASSLRMLRVSPIRLVETSVGAVLLRVMKSILEAGRVDQGRVDFWSLD